MKKKLIEKTAKFILVLTAAGALIGAMPMTFPIIGNYAVQTGLFFMGSSMLEGGVQALSQPITAAADEETYTAVTPQTMQADMTPAQDEQTAETAPANLTSDGKVIRTFYGLGNAIDLGGNAGLKNLTAFTPDLIKDWASKNPFFKMDGGNAPQVLIMHTHATESFEPAATGTYSRQTQSRSTNNKLNMVRIGDEIEAALKQQGIGVIHDTSQNDYPAYNGSYARSRKVVGDALKKYPSIKVVLDVHRDAIESGGVKYAPVVDVNGKKAAQIMVISAADDGKQDHPNFAQNLAFADRITKNANTDYPGLMRPILFEYRNFNQDLTSGSVLVEVGAQANSLDEAIYAGQLFGQTLAKTLKGLT